MRFLLFLSLALCLHAEAPATTGNSGPNHTQPLAVILSPDWASRIPPTGAVNAPGFVATVYPGQQIAVGLLARGSDGAQALAGAKVTVRVAPDTAAPGGCTDLSPVAVRQLKAEGADAILIAMRAAGANTTGLAAKLDDTTPATLAVFVPQWTVPPATTPTDLTLLVEIAGIAAPGTLDPIRLKIRPTSDWLAGPPPTVEEAGRQMNRYRAGVAPGELLTSIAAFARAGQLRVPAVSSHFAFALRANPEARAAAIATCAQADPQLQQALLFVLRRSGEDLAQLFPTLPAAALEPFEGVEPLADPRALPRFRDPVNPQAVSKLGHTMDECWAGWVTTGDKSYLRALVDLLEAAPDFPAYVAWQKSGTGAKGLKARVARGLGYQIAGWSIGSFQRTDPLVMDWLLYWQKDPTVPAVVREQLAALPTNPAFRRQ